MRFQPIVSCRETYQDAVFVPCSGAPFTRCIWTVGIKKFAVTVPTLRPLELLEMRKSMMCACPLTISSVFLVASLLLIQCWSITAMCHAHYFPPSNFSLLWKKVADVLLELLIQPRQGLPSQYTTPLPAPDVPRNFSSAAVEQDKTHPVTCQSCISIPQLFSANSSYVNGYS